MSVFADSSALVKLYADEPGHADVRALASLVVSAIARVEVPAALWRKLRLGELATSDVSLLLLDFEADFHGTVSEPARFIAVAVSPRVLESAAQIVAAQRLRAYDAVQLSSALAAREADRDCQTFACFDEELRTAAAATAFALLPL